MDEREFDDEASPNDPGWDDDWDDREDRPAGGRRDMTVVYAIAIAAVVIVIAVVLTRPQDDDQPVAGPGTEQTVRELQWQGPVGEALDVVDARIASETGVFIWTDFQGWHVRSTLDRPVTVTASADTIVERGPDGEPTGETVTEVTQTIEPGNPSAGIDLDFGFSSSASFTITVDGTPLPANEIKLGGLGQAEQNPVSFTKA
jgi:hypothetical protein